MQYLYSCYMYINTQKTPDECTDTHEVGSVHVNIILMLHVFVSTLPSDHRGRYHSPRGNSGRDEKEERGQLTSPHQWWQSCPWWDHAGSASGNTDSSWRTSETTETDVRFLVTPPLHYHDIDKVVLSLTSCLEYKWEMCLTNFTVWKSSWKLLVHILPLVVI